MLVLSRKTGEEIVIGEHGEIRVVLVDLLPGGKARIGIEAPDGVPVHRKEVAERIAEEAAKRAA